MCAFRQTIGLLLISGAFAAVAINSAQCGSLRALSITHLKAIHAGVFNEQHGCNVLPTDPWLSSCACEGIGDDTLGCVQSVEDPNFYSCDPDPLFDCYSLVWHCGNKLKCIEGFCYDSNRDCKEEDEACQKVYGCY